jgi:outer membrane protein insertion porin family
MAFPSRTSAALAACLLLAWPGAVGAQRDATGPCALPDSIVVEGTKRITTDQVLADAELVSGTALNFKAIQRAIRALYATGQFSDVKVGCRVHDGTPPLATIVLAVTERPILGDITVAGTDRVSERTVKDKVDLLLGRPLDPAAVARVVQRIDSTYQAAGYFLARVRAETTFSGDKATLAFRIEEGRRLAIAGIRINGLRTVAPADVVSAMKTKPEGFLWFRKGEFDADDYQGDIAERIPALMARLGFIDATVERDTLIVDRTRGKGLVDLTIREGPRYAIGAFEVVGNRRFSSDEIQRLYPFQDQAVPLTTRARRLVGLTGPEAPKGTFDQAKWDDATQKVQTSYSNEGYIYARVRPVVERDTTGGRPVANLRWEVEEGSPAIVNRVEVLGNDHTVESCIRNALLVVPGDVFNQDRLIRSYQNIGNLGFFETPLPPPDTRPDSTGDVDIIFRVKEKQTGNVNFGASAGQGLGVGGFVGLQQPNLFGRCKNAAVNINYGRFIQNYTASYTDPQIRLSQLSGTVSAYHTQNRFVVGNFGQPITTGASLQLGFPLPKNPFTRVFVSYGLEGIRFGSAGLLGSLRDSFPTRNVRSTLGATLGYDTRIDMPFASAGSQRTLNMQFSGGLLGGNTSFQRYTTDLRNYATLVTFGGNKLGSNPLKVVAGLTVRGGAVLGAPGAFFTTQQFAMGGVMFGEQLRGYQEFSITPDGYIPGGSGFTTNVNAFGSAFFTTTAEVGVRFNSMFYVNAFFDAGNVYRRVSQFDPTRLFRGTGIGLSTVTPLGPLGLDWAYGMDRTDVFGRPAPAWQLHFRLGQMF